MKRLGLGLVTAATVIATGSLAEPGLSGLKWSQVSSSTKPAEGPGYFYPEAAYRARKSGEVELSCRIAPEGDLIDCKVLKVKPEGVDFDGASLKYASTLKIAPTAKDGSMTVGRDLSFPVHFTTRPRPGHSSEPTVTAVYRR